MQSKFREFIPKKSPSPVAYSLNTSQIFRSTHKDIGFGFGERNFLNNVETASPGPNSYILPSNFDKFKTKKYSPIIDIFN